VLNYRNFTFVYFWRKIKKIVEMNRFNESEFQKKNPIRRDEWDFVWSCRYYPFSQASLKAAFDESVASSPSVSI
jgi:hypothetical protein